MKIVYLLVLLMLPTLLTGQIIPQGTYAVILDDKNLLVVWQRAHLSVIYNDAGDMKEVAYWEIVEGARQRTHFWPTEVKTSPAAFGNIETWLGFIKTAKAEVKEIGKGLYVECFPYMFIGESSITDISNFDVPLDNVYIFHGSKPTGLPVILSVPVGKWKGNAPNVNSVLYIGRDVHGKTFFPVNSAEVVGVAVNNGLKGATTIDQAGQK